MEFLWIENDDAFQEEKNAMSLKQIQRFLRSTLGFEKTEDFSIEPIFGFWRLDRSEAFKLVFEGSKPIISWSVYTYNGVYNSLSQLKRLLSTAAQYEVKGKTYIDCAGTILDALNKLLRDKDYNPVNIIKAVHTNLILTKVGYEKLLKVSFDADTCEFVGNTYFFDLNK